MALFWFLCGILLILGIARYNESNKLFWILLVCFIGAFTAAKIVDSVISNQKKEMMKSNANSTQLYTSTYNTFVFTKDNVLGNTDEETSSEFTTIEYVNDAISYVPSNIRSSFRPEIDKPPQIPLLCYNISTRLDNKTLLINFL